ncbi:MAG: glycosyltransferase, partial [Rhodospirillaceae bacterium]
ILIPTFRRPALLARALAAACRQQGFAAEGSGYQVVVVDNDPDGSAASVVADLDLTDAVVKPRYVSESRPGISHARNRLLAESQGRYVAFLDDDQCPSTERWLRHLVDACKSANAWGAFGPVTAELDCPADDPLATLYADFFSRSYPDWADGADLTQRFAYLGTQNSLFDREQCGFADSPEPFDVDLGHIGGEDSVLLRRLVERGGRYVWAAQAHVTEAVPTARCSLDYVRRRRFRDGQIRSFVGLRMAPPQRLEPVKWMALGAAQSGVHMLGWLTSRITGGTPLARARHVAQIWGGAGKVLWGEPFRFPMYGGASKD